MSRVPIRVRLTATFALATVVVLVGAAAFVYLQLKNDLDDAINGDLQAQLAAGPSRAKGDPEEALSQLIDRTGRVLEEHGVARSRVVTVAEARRLASDTTSVEREVGGYDAPLRIMATSVPSTGRETYFVVGNSLEDRDEALASLIASFLIGGSIAIALASIIGYLLAGSALRPVEIMRRRAAEISLEDGSQTLPLPSANDEVRRLGETLNEMLERLRRSFAHERRFVGDASHELRTPIAIVKAELEAALRSGDIGARARESLVVAIEECDRLAQLAEDLLVIASSADGRLELRSEMIPAGALLAGVRDRFGDRAREHSRTISVDADDRLLIQADPIHIRRALSNLVDNALRYGEGEITIQAAATNEGFELSVSDEGSGLPETFVPHAFERFSRGDEARTRGGTGLGLAIVDAIVEAHGGTCSLDGESSATFVIRLPANG